jgi:2-polyprenyl-3-methyl-5-hydroxy-6-metoxy-1,4-benzoquinol methylase
MPARIRKVFDRDFYERFYFSQTTAVVTTDDIRKQARFILAYMDHLGINVRSVLDAGCGVGLWRSAVQQLAPDAKYTGIEISEYLCERYGWEQTTIADFRSRRKFDLVVCQDVLQYIGDDDAKQSIANLTRLCRGALFFDVPTKEDVKGGSLDRRLTDGDIHLRPARWYRRVLDRDFVAVGGGLFIPRKSKTVVLALERV